MMISSVTAMRVVPLSSALIFFMTGSKNLTLQPPQAVWLAIGHIERKRLEIEPFFPWISVDKMQCRLMMLRPSKLGIY
jgi:uncharacterized membrane protein